MRFELKKPKKCNDLGDLNMEFSQFLEKENKSLKSMQKYIQMCNVQLTRVTEESNEKGKRKKINNQRNNRRKCPLAEENFES